jgi:hypothetical protein
VREEVSRISTVPTSAPLDGSVIHGDSRVRYSEVVISASATAANEGEKVGTSRSEVLLFHGLGFTTHERRGLARRCPRRNLAVCFRLVPGFQFRTTRRLFLCCIAGRLGSCKPAMLPHAAKRGRAPPLDQIRYVLYSFVET